MNLDKVRTLVSVAKSLLLAGPGGSIDPSPPNPEEWLEFGVAIREVLGYVEDLAMEVARLRNLINNPRLDEFLEAVRIEAAHQRERWGEAHDEKKTPEDWYWTLGYLSGKALRAEGEKRLHHVITSAALLFNWFRHLSPHSYTGPSNWIPQPIAQALDCIDREEDEVGMHRQLVDKWRSEERGG